MGLAVTLDLDRLIEPFPLLTSRGSVEREHAPIREVAVVRYGQHSPVRLVFVSLHPLPQVARVVAAQGLYGCVGFDKARLGRVVAENDIAVQVVAAGIRRPLEADEGGESAWIVRILGCLDSLRPGAAVWGSARERKDSFGHLSLAEGDDNV